MNALALRMKSAIHPDPVWLVIMGTLLVLAFINTPQAVASLAFIARAILSVAPVFLVSLFLTAFAKASSADNLIARAFVGHTAPMVLFAAVVGALSPFCSCGVIPLIAALLTMGVPLPAVMAFWLASPLMDPAMFVLTSSVLGLPFALGKTLAAIAVGLIGGYGTWALTARGLLSNSLRSDAGNGGCAGSKVRNPKPVVWHFWLEAERRKAFLASASANGRLLGKMLILAFLLESLMVAYVPAGLIASMLGGTGPGSILMATAIGVPAYLNGTAALPLVRELMSQGMAPGAGMAFLVGGGVTSIPAAIAVWAIARPPVFAAYLGFAVLGAFASGLAYQAFISWP